MFWMQRPYWTHADIDAAVHALSEQGILRCASHLGLLVFFGQRAVFRSLFVKSSGVSIYEAKVGVKLKDPSKCRILSQAALVLEFRTCEHVLEFLQIVTSRV